MSHSSASGSVRGHLWWSDTKRPVRRCTSSMARTVISEERWRVVGGRKREVVGRVCGRRRRLGETRRRVLVPRGGRPCARLALDGTCDTHLTAQKQLPCRRSLLINVFIQAGALVVASSVPSHRCTSRDATRDTTSFGCHAGLSTSSKPRQLSFFCFVFCSRCLRQRRHVLEGRWR